MSVALLTINMPWPRRRCYKHSNDLDIQTMDAISCINLVSISALSAYVNNCSLARSQLNVCLCFYLTVISLAISGISGLK